MNKPLKGLRVIELGQLLAGPFAGCMLGYFGAEVIKVEPPGGDPIRNWREVKDGTSLWWRSLGRNKKCISLDLKTPEGRDLVKQLLKTAVAARPPEVEVGRNVGQESRHRLRPHIEKYQTRLQSRDESRTANLSIHQSPGLRRTPQSHLRLKSAAQACQDPGQWHGFCSSSPFLASQDPYHYDHYVYSIDIIIVTALSGTMSAE